MDMKLQSTDLTAD